MQGWVMDALRVLKPQCIVISVPNEGRRSTVAGARLKRMGMMPGASDLVVLWGGGCGCIELKTDVGRQSESQIVFERKCLDAGVPYRVARSIDEVVAILVEWGRLPANAIDRIRGVGWAKK